MVNTKGAFWFLFVKQVKQEYFKLVKQQFKILVDIFKGGRNRRLSFSSRLHPDGRLHILWRGEYLIVKALSLEDLNRIWWILKHAFLRIFTSLNAGYLFHSWWHSKEKIKVTRSYIYTLMINIEAHEAYWEKWYVHFARGVCKIFEGFCHLDLL